MDEFKCQAPTRNETPCKWDWNKCPNQSHRTWRQKRGLPVPAELPKRGEARREGDRPAPDPMPGGHDIRKVAWWLLDQMARNAFEYRQAAVMATLVRALHAMGPEPLSEDDALAEVALRGLLMHGIPPRTEEEWDLAEELFTDDAVAEFRRWQDSDRNNG